MTRECSVGGPVILAAGIKYYYIVIKDGICGKISF